MLESRRRSVIFFLIAIILAALAGYLVLKKVQTVNEELGEMVDIFVASSEVTSRTILTPNDVETVEIPKKFLREEHITEVDDLMNKVSVVPLSPGELVTTNILKEASDVTEDGKRLVSILSGDNVFFDEQLTALDRVDIIVSHDIDRFLEDADEDEENEDEENEDDEDEDDQDEDDEIDEDEMYTEVFMEDVKVARVAQSDGSFSGVQLEVDFEDAPDLIHMHNFAERFRVIKADVSESEGGIIEQGQDEDLDVEEEELEEEEPENDEENEDNEDNDEDEDSDEDSD